MINKHRTPATKNKKTSVSIVAPQNATQTNNATAKIESKTQQPKSQTQNSTKTLTPKDLVPKLGINERMIRIFLRKHYPQTHEKNKPWSITPELVKQIEKDYKNQAKVKETEKKLRIERDLSGNSKSASATKAASLNADLREANDTVKRVNKMTDLSLERETRFELATFCLGSRHSTTELLPQVSLDCMIKSMRNAS